MVEVREMVHNYEACTNVYSQCQTRVNLLKDYKAEADRIIEDQEARVLAYRDEADAEKRKRNIIAPILGVLGGILAGYMYAHQHN